MANFKSLSRYTNGQVTKNRSGQSFLILRKPLNLVEADGDVLVQVTQDLEKRPDLIASKAYGNPDLAWVIIEFNNIRDPFSEIKAGMLIRIPELNRVLEAIDAIGSK